MCSNLSLCSLSIFFSLSLLSSLIVQTYQQTQQVAAQLDSATQELDSMNVLHDESILFLLACIEDTTQKINKAGNRKHYDSKQAVIA